MSSRIHKADAGLMICVALLFDVANALINLIPLVGQVLSSLITILAYATFWFWFSIKGIKFASGRRVARFFGTSIIEIIPILNVLPAITLGVTLTIADVLTKDAGVSAKPKKPGAPKPKTGGGAKGAAQTPQTGSSAQKGGEKSTTETIGKPVDPSEENAAGSVTEAATEEEPFEDQEGLFEGEGETEEEDEEYR